LVVFLNQTVALEISCHHLDLRLFLGSGLYPVNAVLVP
jgi:hypothetical protein